jgi:hypothetical protein
MLWSYFNYPNPHVTLHFQSTCSFVRPQRKATQRVVRIDQETLSTELQRIKSREYKFAAKAEMNDIWLAIDLGDKDLELAIVKHVHRQFAKSYKPFISAPILEHCQSH